MVGESLHADKFEESGSLDKSLNSYLVNVYKRDQSTKEHPQIDNVEGLFGEGLRARGTFSSFSLVRYGLFF